MTFARRLFYASGIYGFVVLLPFYFLERQLGERFPPAVTHPELYYGFVGVALAWQAMYLLIGSDPLRYRPVMLLGAAGKTSLGVAVLVLYALGRVTPLTVATVMPDLLLALLFVVAFCRLAKAARAKDLPSRA